MPRDRDEMFIPGGECRWEHVLCVDPGLGGTGLAYWDAVTRPCLKAAERRPDNTDLLTAPAHQDWVWRADWYMIYFGNELRRMRPRHVVIETQEVWAGSPTSMASAAAGDLFKLTFLTGVFGGEVLAYGAQLHLVAPGTWKGQLSKAATHRRIKRACGMDYGEHVADAVGMGLAVMGVL